jgi:probable HAF family extracellular repeat protein
MSRNYLLVFAILLLPELWSCGGGGSGARYEVVDVGSLPGGFPSEGFAINADGIVVGKAAGRTWTGISFDEHAFLWQQGVIRDLGTIGGTNSRANALNSEGLVVGSAYPAGHVVLGQAFLHDGYSMRPLPLPSGTIYSGATGVNDVGQVAGSVPINGHGRAVVWDNGVMKNLGVLPGRDESEASGINLAGDVVGTSWVDTGGGGGNGGYIAGNRSAARKGRAPGTTRGFLWSAGQFTELDTLGGSSSYAFGLNSHDVVVGSAEKADGNQHACLWQTGKPVDLGTLGGRTSTAYSINDRG